MPELRPLWATQIADIEAFFAAVESGAKRVCLTRPTGMGKTATVLEIIFRYLREGRRVALYTNRRLLIDQICAALREAELPFGVRAAGYRPDPSALLQVVSMQTEHSRAVRAPREITELKAKYEAGTMEALEYLQTLASLERRVMEFVDAELVIIDECHFAGPYVARLISHHAVNEAVILGVTATPIGLAAFYDVLIGNGRVSEGRACGALVPAIHYACTEPDLAKLKLPVGEEISERKAEDAIMRTGIIGHVLDHFNRLNPQRVPTLLFGPSIAGSLYFAEQFTAAGIRFAHIDGDDVWLDGELHKADREMRKRIIAMHRAGDLVGIANRFVMREGVDLPWVRHLVFATIFGGLQSYLQSGGRGLRADQYEDTTARWGRKEHVTVQDHGGNWWRGERSLNADRHWDLTMTSTKYATVHLEKIRNRKAPEPFCCPACGRVWAQGRVCACGQQLDFSKRSRAVIQHDGTLVEVHGSTLKPRKIRHTRNTQKLWTRAYFRAANSKSGMTFMQAMGLFAVDNYYWPPRTMKYMPLDEADLVRRVRDVPPERLIQVEPPVPMGVTA